MSPLYQLHPLTSLEDWLENPPPHTEWLQGVLVEKSGMTLKHSQIQARLANKWIIFLETHQLGGVVYTDVPCRTLAQGRSPDVAYLTPSLVSLYGQEKVLPQSFPLCAEIVSPTDLGEDIINKAQEYLASGSEEVWLLFPEARWVIVITQDARLIFIAGEVVTAQKILKGFSIAVDDLLSY